MPQNHTEKTARHLRLVPPPEPTELTRLARRDPELREFLRFIHTHGLRKRALELLRAATRNGARPCN